MSVKTILDNIEKINNGEFFRKSKAEDHNTKFELWDTVFVMHENQVVEARICEINIRIVPMPTTTHLTCVKYRFTHLSPKEVNNRNYTDSFAEVDECACYASKEELIQSL